MFTEKELDSSEQSSWELRFNVIYYTACFNLPALQMLFLPATWCSSKNNSVTQDNSKRERFIGFWLCPGKGQHEKVNSHNHLYQMPSWRSSRQTCFFALIWFHLLDSSAEKCFAFRESPDTTSKPLQETKSISRNPLSSISFKISSGLPNPVPCCYFFPMLCFPNSKVEMYLCKT